MITPPRAPLPCHYLAAFYARQVIRLIDVDINITSVNRTILKRITGHAVEGSLELNTEIALKHLTITDTTPELTDRVEQNLATLCTLFDVDAAFGPALGFLVLININQGLNQLVDFVGGYFEEKALERLLCNVSGLSANDVSVGLSVMQQNGILIVDRYLNELQDITIPASMLYVLTSEDIESKAQLLQHVLCPSSAIDLTTDDFSYVDVALLQGYLAEATIQKLSGVNILLYGEAGSGKTALAKVLAQSLSIPLYEARNMRMDEGFLSNEFGAKSSDTQRIQYITMLQSLMGGSDMMLLVDECESLFYSADTHYSKESVHRLLEQNTVPTIWITNYVGELENSFIRRFKLVMPVHAPKDEVLEKMSRAEFKGLGVSSEFHTRLSKTPNLTPALLANASHVARTLGVKRSLAQGVIDDVIENSLTACGLWDDTMRYQEELAFDMSLLNIKQPESVLKQINHAVANNAPIRVLISGPPGTGKTALAHYLAEQHKRELKRVLSSDVLSKYVGGSEKQIARLFQQAHRNNQMLLLDEVDSLLTSRERLNMHHERQVVNELLAQLECFSYPLFAATNFETALDSAILRRFDFKLQCDYLTASQVLTLYKRTVSVQKLSTSETEQLSSLSRLTPGDFALLTRRLRFSAAHEHRQLALAVLTDENNRKQPKTPIGFVK